MARDPRYDILFEPIQIGPKTLRNRFYQVPHCIGLRLRAPGACRPTTARMKAEGGWAACCTEYCSIHPESDDTSGRLGADLGRRRRAQPRRDVRPRARVRRARRHRAVASAARTRRMETRLPRPRRLADPERHSAHSCYGWTKDDIRESSSSTSTRRCGRAAPGFDIIYVYGVARLLCRSSSCCRSTTAAPTSTAARSRTAPASGASHRAGPRGRRRRLRDRVAFLRRHAARQPGRASRVERGRRRASSSCVDHLVDLWDFKVGGRTSPSGARTPAPSRFFEENHEAASTSRQGRPTRSKPVVGVGRFTNPDTMVEIIASGVVDIIGAARPSISDPFLPAEDRRGPARRHPRVHRLQHLHLALGDRRRRMVCTQNATAGEEYRRGWHPEQFHAAANGDKDVLDRGAGPAGMECAMVLGKRDMRRVHLVEAERRASAVMLNWISAAARARRVGADRQLPPDPARQAQERRGHPQDTSSSVERSSSTAPRS